MEEVDGGEENESEGSEASELLAEETRSVKTEFRCFAGSSAKNSK